MWFGFMRSRAGRSLHHVENKFASQFSAFACVICLTTTLPIPRAQPYVYERGTTNGDQCAGGFLIGFDSEIVFVILSPASFLLEPHLYISPALISFAKFYITLLAQVISILKTNLKRRLVLPAFASGNNVFRI